MSRQPLPHHRPAPRSILVAVTLALVPLGCLSHSGEPGGGRAPFVGSLFTKDGLPAGSLAIGACAG